MSERDTPPRQPQVLADVSFLVIDNHPEGAAAPALRALEGWLPHAVGDGGARRNASTLVPWAPA